MIALEIRFSNISQGTHHRINFWELQMNVLSLLFKLFIRNFSFSWPLKSLYWPVQIWLNLTLKQYISSYSWCSLSRLMKVIIVQDYVNCDLHMAYLLLSSNSLNSKGHITSFKLANAWWQPLSYYQHFVHRVISEFDLVTNMYLLALTSSNTEMHQILPLLYLNSNSQTFLH